MSFSRTQNELVKATQGRRASTMRYKDNWFIHNFKGLGFRSPVVLPWIRDHSTGNFFLDEGSVAFELEQDFLMFKLGYQYFD